MSTYLELTVDQGTDPDVRLTLTQDGAPLDLTTASAIELFIKPNRVTPDGDGSVEKLTVGDGIVLTEAAAGICTATFPSSALTVAGFRWWRIDAVISGKRRTAMSGLLRVNDT